jgi:hypothetical protein
MFKKSSQFFIHFMVLSFSLFRYNVVRGNICCSPLIYFGEGGHMARQEIDNEQGTDLIITNDKYISVGENGSDIVIKNGGKMIWFDGEDAWDRFVNAIDTSKASLFTG